jgi:hypothetical protein
MLDPTTRDATGIPRGPCIAEAPRCVRCPCPADDGPYCSDACKDLDETLQHVPALREEVRAAAARGQWDRAVSLSLRIGAAYRHLGDLQEGDDGPRRSTLEFESLCLERLLAGGTLEVRG